MWTKSEPLDRSINQTARAMALWEIEKQGLLNMSYGKRKSLAKKLDISPLTLDRTLAVLDVAKGLAKELHLAILSDARYEEMITDPHASISFENYEEMLKAEGLSA